MPNSFPVQTTSGSAQPTKSLETIFGSQVNPNRPALNDILGVQSTPATQAPITTTPTLGEDITATAKQTKDKLAKTAEEVSAGKQGTVVGGLKQAGDLALGATEVVGDVINHTPIVKDVAKETGQVLSKGITAVQGWLENNPTLNKVVTSKTADKIASILDSHPEIAQSAEAVNNIANALLIADGVIKAGVKIAPLAGNAVDATVSGVTAPFKAARDLTVGTVDKVVDKTKSMFTPMDKIAEVSSSPEVHPFIAASPENAKLVADAVQHGFEPKEIKFLTTIAPADKPAMSEMTKLAETGAGDLRAQYAGKRPADVVGDSILAPLREIQKINRSAGEAVDQTARDLAGSNVDATPITVTANQALERSGVKIMDMKAWHEAVANAISQGDRIPSRFDFSSSVFKKLPAIQKQLDNALSDLPNGQVDAYDVHKFKKSIDQIVEYGKSSDKPLTREAENVLKEIRASADNLLDSNFEAYNKANTDFKNTRELIDQAHEVMGRQTDFLSANANMRVGQATRQLFNNSTKRQDMFSFLQELQKVAKEHGVAVETNPVDQALFAQVLESVYGTPAITGLQGEVGKSIRTAVGMATNPHGTLVQKGIEMLDNLGKADPEMKKKIIQQFVK